MKDARYSDPITVRLVHEDETLGDDHVAKRAPVRIEFRSQLPGVREQEQSLKSRLEVIP